MAPPALAFIDAAAVHAALDWPHLVDALRAAFLAGANAPVRSSYPVTTRGDGGPARLAYRRAAG